MKRFILSILFITLLGIASVAATHSASVTSSDYTGIGGETLTYTVTVEGSGIFSVSSTALTDVSGNTISAPTIGSIDTTTSPSVSFTITVPNSEPAGDYLGTITVTDTADSHTATDPYGVTIASYDSFTVSASSIALELVGDTDSETFTVTNDGSTTLSTWTISFTSDDGDTNAILDNDDDEITISFSSTSSVSPGSSMTITVTGDPDSDIDFGSYGGDISITSGTDSATVALDVTVAADICESGRQGSDFSIDIQNPDSGDDFSAGEIIPVEVDIDNNANDDLDVELEIILYNVDTGDKEKVERVTGTIDEDESETFNVDFELPTSLDEDDDYELYVQVHEEGNEDDSCDYESISIDIERNDEGAVISDVSMTPTIDLACGDDYRVSLDVESTGMNDMENLYVEIRDGDLGVQETSDSFTLGDYNDDDNSQRISFDLVVPTDIAIGSYGLEAILYDNSGNTLDSELITVDVSSCSAADAAGDLQVDVDEDYVVEGSELTLGLTISNSGDEDATITVTTEDVAWAELTGSEYLALLEAGDEAHAYLYFTLDEETTGKHDMQITVTDDLGNEVTEVVTVDFGGEATGEDPFFQRFGDWFAEKSQGSFWIIVDIILVILALVFLRMLFNKR